MKQSLLPLFLPLWLAACLPQSVETRMQACPLPGLADVDFSSGRVVAQGDTLRWAFSGSDRVYMSCRYDDGYIRRQLLPDALRSCAITRTADGKITDFKCQGKI